MAGQRQPIELVLAKGSKHLTKKEIEERKSSKERIYGDQSKTANRSYFCAKI